MAITTSGDSHWYQDAVIYEVHVRSFYDSNGDGVGDFPGLTQKLPYLHDLGVTAVWILPFYPSPLRDDGYDIADYCSINPKYGTLEQFQEFLRTAHRLGIRVITELVLNHTSDEHPWFQKARRAGPLSPWRNFYVWSDTADRYADARIIFQDFETSNWSWDPVAKAYYWHRFYCHQPDLNYDNPRVHRSMLRVIDFWLGMGVDGVRLDAVPYLYEREGTNCENLPETYAFLKKLRAHIDARFPDRMLLAEANQWPEDAVTYLGDGDACHMAFHFPLMPRMFMAVQMEDSFPITNILEQTPCIHGDCQWALFLRNHDELTLEMVTDEERDYMYRVYARDVGARINLGIRRRLAPLMGNDRRKIELMNVLLLTLPGTPILYYGDEIGMGDNYFLGDRNGVRTPMQWSPDRNAGFSSANPQSIYLPVIIDPEYHYEVVNVENQTRNPSSLLWWTRRMLDLRRRHKAFGRGTFEFVPLENPKVLAYLRSHDSDTILVVINLSRFSQVVEINTPRFAGTVPEDLFSNNRFPVIKNSPYVLMLGPHDYHILLLHKEEERLAAPSSPKASELVLGGSWTSILEDRELERLERLILPMYLKSCRWFGGKAFTISRSRIVGKIPLEQKDNLFYLTLVEVSYLEGNTETYLLPLHFLSQAGTTDVNRDLPDGVIARLETVEGKGYLYDAVYHPGFREALLDLFLRKGKVRAPGGELVGVPGRMLKRILGDRQPPFESHLGKVEQSNSTVIYDTTFFLKLYRRIDEDLNPEVEMGRFLTEKVRFPHMPPMAGTIDYRRSTAKPVTLGILAGFVQNQSDAWTFATGELTQFVERVLARRDELEATPLSLPGVVDFEPSQFPPILEELVGGFFPEMAALLGKRTGELHAALASRPDDPEFAPEPYSVLHQRSVYQSIRVQVKKVNALVRKSLAKMSPEVRMEAEVVLSLEREILAHAERLLGKKLSAMKIRTHGDYHLGQVLFTGKDFVIIDFEGEPVRSVTERRIKRSALRDVAGMLHSFRYACYGVLLHGPTIREEDMPYLEVWTEAWQRYVAGWFLKSYLEVAHRSDFIPRDRDEVEVMLNAFMLDKGVYVLGYELNNRPDWVMIPLREIRKQCEILRPLITGRPRGE